MVYAFLVHTVGASPTMLFQSVYTTAGTNSPDGSASPFDNEQSQSSYKEKQLEKLHYIMENVNSELAFQRSVGEVKHIYDDSEFNIETHAYDSGFFQIHADDFFQRDKFVIWIGVKHCAFVLVCEKHENRSLAGIVLKFLISQMENHLHFLTQPGDILYKNDVTATIVEVVLPRGVLLFMSHRVVRKMEKDLDSALSLKI